jgi:hypothetical protein
LLVRRCLDHCATGEDTRRQPCCAEGQKWVKRSEQD